MTEPLIRSEKNDKWSKILIIAGLLLLLLPVLFPLVLAIVALIQHHQFLFDFLMPTELYPAVLIGAVLIFITAFRLRWRVKVMGILALSLILLPLIGQLAAFATGLAHGDTEIGSSAFYLVSGVFVLYDVAILIFGVLGILLMGALIHDSKNKRQKIES